MGSSKAGYSTCPWPTERSSRTPRRVEEAAEGAEGPRPWRKEEKQGQVRVRARSSWSQRRGAGAWAHRPERHAATEDREDAAGRQTIDEEEAKGPR